MPGMATHSNPAFPSFIYGNGAWADWTEYTPRTQLLNDYAIDNFSIKAYLVFNPE